MCNLFGFHLTKCLLTFSLFNCSPNTYVSPPSNAVLREPKLMNGHNLVKLTDGSLSLKDKFDIPSTMSTFAVLNYTRVDNNNLLWDQCFKVSQ
jgi:hypothetical protein